MPSMASPTARLYTRASCVVTGPRSTSPSAGGHNSQWDTDFRRDYRTADAVYLNVDATGEIDTAVPGDDPEALLTAAERRDLLRHRCLLRAPQAAPALGRQDPHWQTNFWPYDWTLTIASNHS